jgi:hypothetical protein
MFQTRRLVVAGLATVAATAALAGSASAATTGDQAVAGTTLSTLSLGVSTPAVPLTNFSPGSIATGTGAVVVTSTNPWTLKAADSAGHAGHLAAAALGCTGSEASTANPLSVTTTGLLGSSSSAGAVSLSGTAQNVATGSFADTLTNAYSLVLGNTETMLTGCAYSTTITYTVQ